MLIDTNIALLTLQPDHPMTDIARRAMKNLAAQRHELAISAQNLIETWAVATRPVNSNGLGLSTTEAAEALTGIMGLFKLLPDTPDILPAWLDIAVTHKLMGKSTHDARLVAAMKVHGETAILTFDAGFNRYPDIEVVNPGRVVTDAPEPVP